MVSLALMARKIFTKNFSGVHYFLLDFNVLQKSGLSDLVVWRYRGGRGEEVTSSSFVRGCATKLV